MIVYCIYDENNNRIDICSTMEEAKYWAAESRASFITKEVIEKEEIKDRRKIVYRYYFVKECNFVNNSWNFEMELKKSHYCFSDDSPTKCWYNEKRGDIIVELEDRDDREAWKIVQKKCLFF